MENHSNVINVDICIGGTGLIECLLAASLASRGYRVLHFDSSDYYGGNSASLTFSNLLKWVGKQENTCKKKNENSEKNELFYKKAADFCMDEESKNLHSKMIDRNKTWKEQINCLEEEQKEFLNLYCEGDDFVMKIQKFRKTECEQKGERNECQQIENDSFDSLIFPHSCYTDKYFEFMPFAELSVTSGCDENYNFHQKEFQNKFQPTNIQFHNEHNTKNNNNQRVAKDHKIEKQKAKNKLLELSNRFFIDISPKLLYSKSDMVDLLVGSEVANYLEFRSLDEEVLFCFDSNERKKDPSSNQKISKEDFECCKNYNNKNSFEMCPIPSSKSYIFTNKTLTLVEKRLLMRFINFVINGFPSPQEINKKGFLSNPSALSDIEIFVPQKNVSYGSSQFSCEDASWLKYLENHKLNKFLRDCITFGICFGEDDASEWSSYCGALRMYKFISSLGLYSSIGPFMYPICGNGEIPQGFTRACCLHGGIYILRSKVSKIVFTDYYKNENKKQDDLNKNAANKAKSKTTDTKNDIINDKNHDAKTDFLTKFSDEKKILERDSTNFEDGVFLKVKSLELTSGVTVNTEIFIGSLDNLPPLMLPVFFSPSAHTDESFTSNVSFAELLGLSLPLPFSFSSISSSTSVNHLSKNAITSSCHLVAITSTALLGGKGFRCACSPPLFVTQNHVIRIIQLDFTSGCCPEGFYIIHLSHSCTTGDKCKPSFLDETKECESDHDIKSTQNDEKKHCLILYKFLQQLLLNSGGKYDRCLFICSYKYFVRIDNSTCQKLADMNYNQILKFIVPNPYNDNETSFLSSSSSSSSSPISNFSSSEELSASCMTSSSLISEMPLSSASSSFSNETNEKLLKNTNISPKILGIRGISIIPDTPVSPMNLLICEPHIAGELIGTLLGVDSHCFVDDNFKNFIIPLKRRKKTQIVDGHEKEMKKIYFDESEDDENISNVKFLGKFFEDENLEELEKLTSHI